MTGESGENTLVIRCACGQVEFRAQGAPIASLACYCDDCQEGSRLMEALAGARPVTDGQGGSSYTLYRKDRVFCVKGRELLEAHKVRETSPANRLVAACCNSVLLLGFDDGRPWVSVYRAGIEGEPPPLQLRIFTKFAPYPDQLPRDVPRFATYPLWFVLRMVVEKLGTILRPHRAA